MRVVSRRQVRMTRACIFIDAFHTNVRADDENSALSRATKTSLRKAVVFVFILVLFLQEIQKSSSYETIIDWKHRCRRRQLKHHHHEKSSSNNHQRHRPGRRRTLARLRSEKFHHAPRTWRENHARRERRDDAVQRYASRKCLREVHVRGVSRGLGEVMPRRRTSIDTRRVRRDRRQK